MGNFYTNVTLKTSDREAVAAALRRVRRSAMVTPADGGCVVVYDKASDEQDPEVLKAVAAQLADACDCPALAVMNHDDSVLLCTLYERGKLVDEYNSAPGFFDGDAAKGPAGGDAKRLCEAFGSTADAPEVERILRAGPGKVTFETDRHEALVQALGISRFAVGTGYNGLAHGDFPEGLDSATVRRVDP